MLSRALSHKNGMKFPNFNQKSKLIAQPNILFYFIKHVLSTCEMFHSLLRCIGKSYHLGLTQQTASNFPNKKSRSYTCSSLLMKNCFH